MTERVKQMIERVREVVNKIGIYSIILAFGTLVGMLLIYLDGIYQEAGGFDSLFTTNILLLLIFLLLYGNLN